MATDPGKLRSIRSFVRRQGRLTSGQARALESHWHRFGIEFTHDVLDLNLVFNRVAPRVIDIGSGMGDTTIELARTFPENDYLAIEVHKPGVGSLIRKAVESGISNIRVINHDVMDILRYQLPENSLDEVLVMFPDPWPKKRHHKRRLVGPEFLALLKPKLRQNARIFLATDWKALAQRMQHVCDRDNELVNLAGPGNFAPRAAWRSPTRFENRGKRLQHDVFDLCYSLSDRAR